MSSLDLPARLRVALLGLAVGLLAVLPAPAAALPSWRFTLEPAGGGVVARPGESAGWGYTLHNDDPARWLVATTLDADPFLLAAPNALFDFPVLAPLGSLSVHWGGGAGLYEITWDSGAPVGHVESGRFVLGAEWFDADPLAGGVFLEAAESLSADYQATVIPEPAPVLLLGAALAALGGRRRAVRA